MHYFPKVLMLLIIIFLCGCESSTEKAERIRLEKLYALDDYKVARSYLKADTSGAAYTKEYLAIQRECAKEEQTNKGKWCVKHYNIQKIYRGMVSESLRNGLSAPKF